MSLNHDDSRTHRSPRPRARSPRAGSLAAWRCRRCISGTWPVRASTRSRRSSASTTISAVSTVPTSTNCSTAWRARRPRSTGHCAESRPSAGRARSGGAGHPAPVDLRADAAHRRAVPRGHQRRHRAGQVYGATDGHKFVNGVLDKLAPSLRSAEVRNHKR